MPPPIALYAELNPHIRQLSLAATLPSPVSPSAGDPKTSAHISHSGTVFTIHHGLDSATLRLPGAVKPGEVELAIPTLLARKGAVSGPTELSWRLALADEGAGARARANGTAPARLEPWSAADLVPGSEVRCRGCETVIVRKGSVREWKDLPSEGWAEMMDFWHCHKPHDHGHGKPGENGEGQNGNGAKASEDSLASRAYGANAAIAATRGVGFVGLTEFMLEDGDVEGVVYSASTFNHGHPTLQDASASASSPSSPDSPAQRRMNLFCTHCRTQLGSYAPRISSLLLLKWALNMPSLLDIQPTLSTCLVAALVANLARSGSAKCLILPYSFSSPNPAQAIRLWLFNASARYSSNCRQGSPAEPVPATRVFFRLVGREEAERIMGSLDGGADDAQEIEVPGDAVRALGKMLEESNALLPRKESAFKEWRVGLLERSDDDG